MVGEEMSKELESSLPVENVQALASNNPLVDESLQIPIIDMRKLMVEDDEMGKLHLACKEWGFFSVNKSRGSRRSNRENEGGPTRIL